MIASSDLRRELFNRMLKDRGITASAVLSIPRRSVGSTPASFAQQRIWFLQQLTPDSSAYNLPAALRLDGPLDLVALKQALTELVERHEILRTTFVPVDGQLMQQIAAVGALPLTAVALDGSEVQGQIARRIADDARAPFDLAAGPLVRATLIRLADLQHVLLFSIHHIVCDGWSTAVLVQELGELYDACVGGRSPVLPVLSIQYADFALWQRGRLAGPALEKERAYWKQQLGGAVPELELPTDGSAERSIAGGTHTVRLSAALTSALKALGERESATLFMTLLAAFKIVLGRWSGQEDIRVGTPVAGRSHAQTEPLIGLFLNTLVLRTSLQGDPTFCALLAQVKRTCVDAYAHQELPFEKLVEELRPDRNLHRNPLYQVMFNLVNTPQSAMQGQGLTFVPLELPETDTKLPLTVYAEERDGAVVLRLAYQRSLYSAERMRELGEQFRLVLEQVAKSPQLPIGALSLLTDSARSVLADPAVALDEPVLFPVTEQISDWAKKAPLLPSICQGERSWTYAQLDTAARATAAVLCERGLKPGDAVAVLGPPSFGLIASIVGVLRSGGVLLTLDRQLPLRRQLQMVSLAQARWVLRCGAESIAELEKDRAVLEVDPASGQPNGSIKAVDTPTPPLRPEDPAYLFFTSGTTGQPKGVRGCHKGLAHFVGWERDQLQVGPGDRVAQLTGLSFDVVLRDIFLPLVSGATLCLPDEQLELGPGPLLGWLERQKISLLHTVPAVAQTWLGGLTRAPEVSLRALRWVLFAGEPLNHALVRRWREAFPASGAVGNLYGPTETTLAKCFFEVPPEPAVGVQPVGRALPNAQALVLDKNRQRTGIGEVGEIVIRTPFRSLGYLGGSEEDARRFVPNPFRQDPTDLIYFTGDRGRFRPDGALEILGRVDFQVKIRGMRVEPREIEQVLSEHPSVRQTLVIARATASEEKELVAYLTSAGQPIDLTALRAFLRERLPGFMVPAHLVPLEAFPLTANGKVDRAALPSPSEARATQGVVREAPATALERTLCTLWSGLLGLPEVGVTESFFDLGGHSLMLIRLQAELHSSLGREVSLVDLFTYPSIRALAERLEQGAVPPPTGRLEQSTGRGQARRESAQRLGQSRLKARVSGGKDE